MHSRFRLKGLMLAALALLVVGLVLPTSASAEPLPGAKHKGFRLFARALGAMTINQVYCGLASDGRVCVDSTNSSTIGGGFWPKGTPDQYVFNSGLQLAGIIGPDGGPWVGDTTGAFFFDPKGTTEHGEEVQPIYNISNPDDARLWPAAACVPNQNTDPVGALFDPLLQVDATNTTIPNCRRSASQGDVWFLSTEANPSLKGGRSHPLGIAVETRGMGWNFPAGNEGVLYFIYTFYNISSNIRTDYDSTRTALADLLFARAKEFHAAVAAQGTTLPVGGYTITNLFAAFAADMDVANAGTNYASVNLPFALGYTYDNQFSRPPGWLFDPSLFSAPFFEGSGFVGVKYLKSPTGPGAIQLFSNTINGGAFGDPGNTVQLYRYLSGAISTAAGDAPCNTGTPSITHICYVNNSQPADMRFFQSSTPLTLAPGQGGSIVVAYIFAAPVTTAGCGAGCDVKPGDPLLLTDPVGLVSAGTNLIDSLSGFRGYTDGNADGIVQQSEMTVVKGSLLGKSLVAQAVFDGKFLLPFAPDPPEFFLIPGDNQITVIWRPTTSEVTGDPYFGLASQPQVIDPVTNGLVSNVLYDPNYRQFDVEGYRVYRGRIDAPNELTLLAQFDYGGTVITDYTGSINPTPACAPEFSVLIGCPTDPSGTITFPVGGNKKNGTTLTFNTSYDLVGNLIQLNAGSGRSALAVGFVDSIIKQIDTISVGPPVVTDTLWTQFFTSTSSAISKADTAVSGGGKNGGCGPKSVCPVLSNSGIPFSFVDATPRNNLRYFYSVTAFDVNSIESGPSSLESPRNTKSITPVAGASNYISQGSLSFGVVGRGVRTDSLIPNLPTIDPTVGTFSGPMPPANGAQLAFVGQFVSKVFAQPGQVSAKLIDLTLGDARNGVPATYTFDVTSANGLHFTIVLPIQEQLDGTVATASSPPAAFAVADSALLATYGIPAGTALSGLVTTKLA